eukprot:TRINITY_DN20094_c0_g1_i1.p1 TRINITY_DN20094_c0_g1~~TRINITY_DN20094_c0_g1_i1.p1  ORF type:complete len:541 (+),score=194.30 TRINITY_DN20094_c0_g1_i1:53-1624(+)
MTGEQPTQCESDTVIPRHRHEITQMSPPIDVGDAVTLRNMLSRTSVERDYLTDEVKRVRAEKAALEASLHGAADAAPRSPLGLTRGPQGNANNSSKINVGRYMDALTDEVLKMKAEKAVLLERLGGQDSSEDYRPPASPDKLEREMKKALNEAAKETSELKTELKMVKDEMERVTKQSQAQAAQAQVQAAQAQAQVQAAVVHAQSPQRNNEAEVLAERRKGLLEVKEVEMQRVRSEFHRLEADYQNLLRKNAALETELSRQTSATRQHRDENERLLRQRASSDADTESSRRRVTELELENSALRTRLEKEERRHKDDENDLKSALKEAVKKVESLEGEVKDLMALRKEHMELEAKLICTKTQLSMEIESSVESKEAIQKFKYLKEANAELEEKVARLKTAKDALEDENSEKTGVIRKLKVELQEVVEKNEVLMAKVKTQESVQVELHSRLRSLMDSSTSERRDLEARISSQTGDIDKLQAELKRYAVHYIHSPRTHVDDLIAHIRSRSPSQPRYQPISPLAPF